jgi:hypothetical protein
MSMVARYYTSVTWLGKQADELVVLVTCGLSGTSSNYSATLSPSLPNIQQ